MFIILFILRIAFRFFFCISKKQKCTSCWCISKTKDDRSVDHYDHCHHSFNWWGKGDYLSKSCCYSYSTDFFVVVVEMCKMFKLVCWIDQGCLVSEIMISFYLI